MTNADPPRYTLGIDPGLTTGWAIFHGTSLKKFGQVRGVLEFDEHLENLHSDYQLGDKDQIVFEEFKLFRGKAMQQSGSKFETVQVIGAIESFARRNKIAVARQAANILPIAQKFSKLEMPKNHKNSHWVSAANHAIYFFVKNKMMLPIGMEVRKK